jgi:AcrR family transcriptional regulator
VTEKALAAARTLYAERGWSGFSLDQVARKSGLGKGSLYLRWPDRGDLLVDAIQEKALTVSAVDTGSLRGDLLEFSRRWLEYRASEAWVLHARLELDALSSPELRAALDRDAYPAPVRSTRALVHRGIERGDLPPHSSTALIANLVAGAIETFVSSTTAELRQTIDTDAYVELIVDTVLAGVASTTAARKKG